MGERWTLLIVRDAFLGVRRFSDFQAHLDAPKAVLSERLSDLVEAGVMERVPDPEHRGRNLYELTARGRELWPAIHALMSWGGRHLMPSSRVYKHAACGTILDDRGGCPECGVVVPPEDVVSEPRPLRVSKRTDRVAVALGEPHRLLEPLVVPGR